MPAEAAVRDGSRRETDLAARGVPASVVVALGADADAARLGFLSSLADPPYTVEISGTADGVVGLSLTVPAAGGGARRARLDGIVVRAGSRHRVVYDPPPRRVDLGSIAGDGRIGRAVALALLTSEGPQLVAAATIGPETLDGASPFGTYAALLFDRVVAETDAASPARYQIADNSVLAAKRQLSGRLVFVALEQPEGPLVPARLAIEGIHDERGRGGLRQELPLGSRLNLPGAVVNGRVLQADGTPVADAVVTYLNSSAAHADGRGLHDRLGRRVSIATDAARRFLCATWPGAAAVVSSDAQDPPPAPFAGQTCVRVSGQRRRLDLVLIGLAR
jgi:hypothetical protein